MVQPIQLEDPTQKNDSLRHLVTFRFCVMGKNCSSRFNSRAIRLLGSRLQPPHYINLTNTNERLSKISL